MKLRTDLMFADQTNAQLFDEVIEQHDGSLMGAWSKLTFEQIIEQHPTVIMVTRDEYEVLHYQHFATQPRQVTRDDFWQMLEVLPPLDMHTTPQGTSFKMAERYSHNITDIYAQIGDTYWNFRDKETLPHSEIMNRITAAAVIV